MAYEPKILLLDIENTPARGYFFGKTYETSILSVTDQPYILCYAYLWYPNKKPTVVSLRQFKGYKKGNDCEEKLMESLWKLLDEADIVVGQNAKAFDIKHINTRFAFYGMTPPRPYKVVDTLVQLRNVFNLPSNKLDFVCNYFGIGRKLPNTGKDLWLACMDGNKDDWKMMEAYNANDIYPTLYGLYKLLLPWGKQPNLNLLTNSGGCHACGHKHFHERGHESSYGRIYKRLLCVNCGAWNRDFGERRESKITIRPL